MDLPRGRPAHGDHNRWNDEHWRDHVLFYEYFHGDSGTGIGASHQTGWTGVIAFLIQGFTAVEAEKVLEKGMDAVTEVSAEVAEEVHEQVAEKVVAQVLETVQQQVAEAVQDQAEQLQKKVEQIVIEKVAETVEKKPRRFSSKPNSEPRKRRMSFKSLSGSHNVCAKR